MKNNLFLATFCRMSKTLRHAPTDHDRKIEREQTSERTPQTGPRFPNKESAVAWDFSMIPLCGISGVPSSVHEVLPHTGRAA
jgi:hypothetical protein